MDSKNRFTGMVPFGGGETAIAASRPLSPLAIIAATSASYNTAVMTRNASYVAMKENVRMALAKNALDCIAALSALEAHLNIVTPEGAERYKTLIDCFSLGAAIQIGRF